MGRGWAARAAAVAKTFSKYAIGIGVPARFAMILVSATIIASVQPVAIQTAARSATPYQFIGAAA